MSSTPRPWWVKRFYPLLRMYFRWRTSRLRLRWKKTGKSVLITVIVIILLLIAFVVAVYVFGLDTGFNAYSIIWTVKNPNGAVLINIDERQPAKNFWDLLQLAGIVAIPVIVGLGAARFTAKQEEANRKQRELEQHIADDNQREAFLQDYFNHMSDLMFEKNLRKSELGAEVRAIARARTLTVISRLDEKRKRNVVEFLYEAGLIERDKAFVNLKGANLAKVCLDRASLRRVNFAEVNLERVFINFRADLTEANLQGANLSDVQMTGSSLEGANLRGVNLIGASLISMNFRGADLEGAHMFAKLGFSNFDKANLRSVNLKEADLSDTSLVGANLSNADIEGANLEGADLTGADLTGANITGAIITRAIITKEQLNKAESSKGIIGIDTIRATKPSGYETVSIDEI